MSDDINAKVQQFNREVKQKAEALIVTGIPETIFHMNAILTSEMYANCNFQDYFQELNIPVEKSDSPTLLTETVHCNQRISESIKIVKPMLLKLINDLNLLNIWAFHLVPKVEDGNNFGVIIQTEMLSEMKTLKTESARILDEFSKYYIIRGGAIMQIARHPQIEDYRHVVLELDERMLVTLCALLREIRNRYVTLHDYILKNIEKILNPRD